MTQSERTAWILAAVEFVAIGILLVMLARANGRADGTETRAKLWQARCEYSAEHRQPCGWIQ